MRGGQNRKTAEEHKRAGTYQKCRHDPTLHDAVEFADGAMDCPATLDDLAKKEWFRIAPILKDAGFFKPAFRTSIIRYCVLAGQAEEAGRDFGDDKELRQYIGLLGLAPLAASRIRPSKKAEQKKGSFDDL